MLSYRSYADTRRYLNQHPDEYPDNEMADTVRTTQTRVGKAMVLEAMDSMPPDG